MEKKVSAGRIRRKELPAHGLPAALSGAELDARRAERLGTIEVLKTGRTPLKVIEVAERATALAEKTIQDFMATNPPPLACKEGCDWCCYMTVGTTVPEVFRIVDYLSRTLGPEELRATVEGIVRLDDRKRELKAQHRGNDRLPCALLVDHRCSVYAVRPLTCRGFNSSDARQCELSLSSANRVQVPVYAAQLRLTAFVLDGMRAGLAESGLVGERLELTAALRIAFQVPDAVQRYLAGEPVFARARLD